MRVLGRGQCAPSPRPLCSAHATRANISAESASPPNRSGRRAAAAQHPCKSSAAQRAAHVTGRILDPPPGSRRILQTIISMASSSRHLFGSEVPDPDGDSPRKRPRTPDDDEEAWVRANDAIEVVLGTRDCVCLQIPRLSSLPHDHVRAQRILPKRQRPRRHGPPSSLTSSSTTSVSSVFATQMVL